MPSLISFQLFPFNQWGFCLFSFLRRFPAVLLQLLGLMPISFISFQLFSFSHLGFCLFSSEVSSYSLSVIGVFIQKCCKVEGDVTKEVRYDLLIYSMLSDIILYFLFVAASSLRAGFQVYLS